MIAWLKKHHWIHDWSMWTTTTGTKTILLSQKNYDCVIQVRSCNRCGRMEVDVL